LVTFDQAMATVLDMVGERVEVQLVNAGEARHPVANFGGTLHEGLPMRIYLRIDPGGP
jgi:hypothetical protein